MLEDLGSLSGGRAGRPVLPDEQRSLPGGRPWAWLQPWAWISGLAWSGTAQAPKFATLTLQVFGDGLHNARTIQVLADAAVWLDVLPAGSLHCLWAQRPDRRCQPSCHSTTRAAAVPCKGYVLLSAASLVHALKLGDPASDMLQVMGPDGQACPSEILHRPKALDPAQVHLLLGSERSLLWHQTSRTAMYLNGLLRRGISLLDRTNSVGVRDCLLVRHHVSAFNTARRAAPKDDCRAELACMHSIVCRRTSLRAGMLEQCGACHCVPAWGAQV